MNFVTAPVIYALLAISALLGLATGVQTLRLSHEHAAHLQTKVDHAAVLQDLATKTAEVAAAVRQREQTYAQGSLTAQAKWKEQTDAALNEKNALVADLRHRLQQLQPWWDPAVSTACPGGAADFGLGADETSDLRFESAGRIVESADRADADIAWLQATLIDTRKACGVNP